MTYTKIAEIESSSSDRKWVISRNEDGQLSCNCPSWIYKSRQGLVGENRFCKHIEAYWQRILQ